MRFIYLQVNNSQTYPTDHNITFKNIQTRRQFDSLRLIHTGVAEAGCATASTFSVIELLLYRPVR